MFCPLQITFTAFLPNLRDAFFLFFLVHGGMENLCDLYDREYKSYCIRQVEVIHKGTTVETEKSFDTGNTILQFLLPAGNAFSLR